MGRFIEEHKAKVARRREEAVFNAKGRDIQIGIAQAEARRIAEACDRPASFNMVLCQCTPPGRISPARYAAMVASVAIGTTTEDDTFLGILATMD